MRTRFAPSPTGSPHLGSLHTALFAWIAARQSDGKFVVRIDDTDAARSRSEFEQEILDALTYIGIDWDESIDRDGGFGPYRQSERMEIYGDAIDRLKSERFLYPCFCTKSDLDLQRASARAAGRPYIYDGRCREIDLSEANERIQSGEECVWRFHVDEKRLGESVEFKDLVHGVQVFKTELIGDFVCIRSDGKPTYMLVSPLDDALMRISHVIRGSDHLPNTPAQILLLRALGYEPPEFAHLPLITGKKGKKLSKRDSLTGLDELRQYLPSAIVNHLVLLGWTHPDAKEILTINEILDSFSFDRVSTSSAAHAPARLKFIEREHIVSMSPDELLSAWEESVYSDGINLDDQSEQSVLKILGTVGDEITSLKSITDDVLPLAKEPDEDALRSGFSGMDAAESLVPINAILGSCGGKWTDLIEGLVATHGKKMVYLPLRIALTGVRHGFEISRLLSALTVEEVLKRLETAKKVIENAG